MKKSEKTIFELLHLLKEDLDKLNQPLDFETSLEIVDHAQAVRQELEKRVKSFEEEHIDKKKSVLTRQVLNLRVKSFEGEDIDAGQ